MPKLTVNVDHVATVRQARRGNYPNPLSAAVLARLAGADGITVHLREDRRHIQDGDVRLLRQFLPYGLNLEMAAIPGIVDIACKIIPDMSTIVPEKREELTTEGGLDCISNEEGLKKAIERLKGKNIVVSLFIDPDIKQINLAAKVGADFIEIHTGHYADNRGDVRIGEIRRIKEAAAFANGIGLKVNAGHGLDYDNVKPIADIPQVEELAIGHSIVSRAVLVGMEKAVREMIGLIKQ